MGDRQLLHFMLVILLLSTAYFWNENNLLRLQLADRQSELAAAHAELGAKDAFMIDARQSLLDFRRDIDDVRQELEESREWFIGNSRMPARLGGFTADVWESCVSDGSLDLPCVEVRMRAVLGLRFKSEWHDKLHSIDEMLERGGGDCEDYSLFMMALLATMKDEGAELTLKAGEKGRISPVLQGLSSADPEIELGCLQSLHPVAVCYTISSRGDDINGHCINALSPGPIRSAADLGLLEGMPTFDPQNGRFTGTIGSDFLLCMDGDSGCHLRTGSIGVVITDDDIYEFKGDGWMWLGGLDERAAHALSEVDRVLSMPGASRP